MYLNIKRSNRKPDSFKLIRQLKCYLYLLFQRQVDINAILKSEERMKEEHSRLPESLRTFYRYIGEIMYCVNDCIQDKDDQWVVYYSQGSFYRKDENFRDVSGSHSNINFYLSWIDRQQHASCIQPIAPSKGHRERLDRMMFLTRQIVSEYNNMDLPLSHFLFDWPTNKEKIKEYYDSSWGLNPRTVQRDIGVVYEVITSYLFDNEREDSTLTEKKAGKNRL